MKLPIFAFCTSVLVHVSLLVLVPAALHAAAGNRADAMLLARADPPPMVLPVELKIDLGIDAPTPPSPTWMGHAEPEPQLASPSVIEQAAFTDEPIAASAPPPMNPPPPPPQPAPAPENALAAAMALIDASRSVEAQPDILNKEDGSEAPGPIISATPIEATGSAPQPHDLAQLFDPAAALIKALQQVPAQPVEHPVSSTPPAEPSPHQPHRATESQASESPPNLGAQADKESAPTSILDVPPDQWMLGKPMAGRGLQLKPRRPTLTVLTLMTAAPGNPLCLIKFGRDGVPAAATLLRGSGDSRVDDAILASLYRWRAAGDQLAKLPEGDTIDVRIRLLLNRRAAAAEGDEDEPAR